MDPIDALIAAHEAQPQAPSDANVDALIAAHEAAQPQQRPSWSQVIGNIPSDIGKTVEEIKALPGTIGTAVTHPVDTATAIGKASVGGLVNQGRQLAGAFTGGLVGETQEEALARIEAARKQAIERPLTTVANIALQGMPSGELTAGQAALKGLTATAREASNVPTWLAAGVGRKSSNAMLEAGRLGGPEGAAARAAMSGGDATPVARAALNAADQIAADKNAAYLADAQKWNIPGGMADVSGIDQALADARVANSVPGTNAIRNQQAAAALDRIDEIVKKHTTIPGQPSRMVPVHGTDIFGQPVVSLSPGQGFGPTKVAALPLKDMDALKQAIGEVMYDKNMAPPGSRASVHASKIYDAAKDAVSAVSPEYAAAMERSQAAIRNLKDLRQEMSLKPNASKGAILTKLQSAMRNDVSSKFGYRGQLLDQLTAKAPTLPYALAGQDFSSWYPRGLSKIVPGMEGAAALHAALTGSVNPTAAALAVPLLAMSSPRLMGEARYGLGALSRGARAIGATQKNIGRVGEAARVAGLLTDQNQQPRGLLNP